jgi:2-polyprenyl-3-methyl-5-hydroxy-6-metoxy-1,4-benzoquinol methylase
LLGEFYIFWLHSLSLDKGFTNLPKNLDGLFVNLTSINLLVLLIYPWVTQAVVPHLGPKLHIWEPAAGGGKMVRALAQAGCTVEASDIADGRDF